MKCNTGGSGYDPSYDDNYYDNYHLPCNGYYGYNNSWCSNGGVAGGWIAFIIILILVGIGIAVFLIIRHQKRRKAGLTGNGEGANSAINLDDTEASLVDPEPAPKKSKIPKQKAAPISSF